MDASAFYFVVADFRITDRVTITSAQHKVRIETDCNSCQMAMCGMFWTVALTIYKSDFHLTGTFESGDEARLAYFSLGNQ